MTPYGHRRVSNSFGRGPSLEFQLIIVRSGAWYTPGGGTCETRY